MAITRLCSIPGCGKLHVARGFCSKHYQRLKKHGDPLFSTWYEGAECEIEDCTSAAIARNLCHKHWRRLRVYGDPSTHIRSSQGEAENYLNDVVLSYSGDDCLIWPFDRTEQGYARIKPQGNGTRVVPRIVCERIYGDPPTPEHEAAHSCANGHGGCVNPKHLRWATRLENAADMVIHGNSNRGTRAPTARLTPNDVRRIRHLGERMQQKEIARIYRVSPSTVRKILVRESWAWLE